MSFKKGFFNCFSRYLYFFYILGLLFFPLNRLWSQYQGVGVFTKINSINELTDGYYVITNSDDELAMNESNTNGINEVTTVSSSIGVITNPPSTIVWRIQTDGSGRVIYNMSSMRYVSYSGFQNNIDAVSTVANDAVRWSFSYSSRGFVVKNLNSSNRQLKYQANNNNFACYNTGNVQNLHLFKIAPIAINATGVNSSNFTANWNAILGATSYFLDVSTTPFTDIDIVGWTFPASGTITAPDITSTNNSNNALSVVGAGPISSIFGSTTYAPSASQWEGGANTKYWLINANTLGHSNLRLTAIQKSVPNGPKDFKIQYRIGQNGVWMNVPLGDLEVSNNYYAGVTDVVLPSECNNQPLLYIRWLMTSNTSVNGQQVSNGSYSSIDNIALKSENTPNYVAGYNNLSVGNVTSYVITGLNEMTSYYYRVRVKYSTSVSLSSNTIVVKTYKDINKADFRSRVSGNYSVPSTWEYDTGNSESGWLVATQLPGINNNVIINSTHTVTLTQNILISAGKSLTVKGTLLTLNYSISGAGSLVVASSATVASSNTNTVDAFAATIAVTGGVDFQSGSTFELNAIVPQYLGARTFTRLKINNKSGVKAKGNITVKEQLYLIKNPDETNGALDMIISYGSYATNRYGDNSNGDFRNSLAPFNDLNSYILTMEPQAITVGPGDVTGKIRRTSIVDNTVYTFGNVNTQLRFTSVSGSALPTQITVVATRGAHGTHIDNIGNVQINDYTANRNTVKRLYQILHVGGSSATRFTLRMAYEDSELNGNVEDKLVTWDHHIPYGGRTPHEHGKTSYSPTENWVELSNHSVSYLAVEGDTTFTKYWMISNKESVSDYVWLGAVNSNWNILSNWSGGKIPDNTSNVLIPDAISTNNDPLLTATSGYGISGGIEVVQGEVKIRSLEIATGGVLNVQTGDNVKMTIYGGPNTDGGGINYGSWDNKGTFNPGNSEVIFDYDSSASESTISGSTQFYNLSIAAGKKLTIQSDTEVKLFNKITNNGVLDASSLQNTFTYNGNVSQTVLPIKYHNLTISNSFGVILGGNVTVFNSLSLFDKIINTSNYKMTIGATGSVSRTSGYVKGTLEKTLTTSNPYVFEIGSDVYSPVTITPNEINGQVLVSAKANLGNSVPESILNPLAKANTFWLLSKSGTGTIKSYTASFNLANTTNTGLLSNYKIAHNNLSNWTVLPTTISGSQFTTSLVFDFGIFDLGQTKKTIWNGVNWNPSTPNLYIDAIIDGPYSTAQNGGFEANSVIVNPSKTLILAPNTSLTVANEIVNNSSNDAVIVENNAHLIQLNDVINSGAVTIKRSSSPMIRLDYTFWSSPVFGQNLFAFSPFTLTNRFYLFDSQTNYYTTTGLNSASNFNPAIAYVVRAPNNHPTTPTSWMGVFKGIPNNGKYVLPLNTNGKRINGIGNPYPSPIDAAKFIRENKDIDGTLYFFAHTGTGNSAGQFASWNLSGGVAASTQTTGAGTTEAPNGIIQIGQGFLVRSNPLGGTVVFTNNQRTINYQNQFFRTTSQVSNALSEERHRIWLNLITLQSGSSTNVFENQMLVGYVSGATNGIDRGYDGLAYDSSGTQLTTKMDNNNYIIQGRGLPFDINDFVPLAFKASTTGTFQISLANLDGLFESNTQNIYLKDFETGITHNLKSSPYVFSANEGIHDQRFQLVFTENSLGIDSSNVLENGIKVYIENNKLNISSFQDTLKEVFIYDLSGRLLFKKLLLNTSNLQIDSLAKSKELIIIKIKSNTDVVTTKKFIF
ncbi:MAG: hypothetical protein ACOVMH_09565 [Flavobacterium sp.]